jgi:hypothetical protein
MGLNELNPICNDFDLQLNCGFHLFFQLPPDDLAEANPY